MTFFPSWQVAPVTANVSGSLLLFFVLWDVQFRAQSSGISQDDAFLPVRQARVQALSLPAIPFDRGLVPLSGDPWLGRGRTRGLQTT